MTAQQRFLDALKLQPVDRPPWWMMRQAGRYLPEYRKLKETHDFLTLVKTPELACEVTMQPLHRFPLDAAILFSDILVIPEALGQAYHFRDAGGIEMDFTLDTARAIQGLNDPECVEAQLDYVPAALKLIHAELEKMANRPALLGFGGSPWTLATYMVEGGSTKEFTRAKTLFYQQPKLFEDLMERLTAALVHYFRMQARSGVDAIQIFDSWGAACPAHDYEAMSLSWIRRIIAELDGEVPVILYARGMGTSLIDLADTGASCLSLDWTLDLADADEVLEDNQLPRAVQGNLDPCLLCTSPKVVRKHARRLLESMADRDGFIFNLGHGILPSAKIECVEALAETITSWTRPT